MDFYEVRQKVFEKTPVLKRIIETSGTMPLEAYFSGSVSAECLVSPERKNELLSVVEELLCSLIGPTAATEARRELSERYAVSTADHHGPLAHPFFFSCHLAQAAALARGNYRYLFVFSCGGISLNNSSFPRGLLFHDEALDVVRVPFFSLKHRHQSVYGLRGYGPADVVAAMVLINAAQLSPVARERLLSTVSTIYADPRVVPAAQYADQITTTNFALFKKLPGQEDMNFISLQQEDIVADLLVRYHFGRGTILERLFTDPTVAAAFEVCFDGIIGAFSKEQKHGTMLAWAIINGERVGLWRRGNELVSADGTYRIILNAENLREAFLQKELLPSMALSFVVLSFYYGLTCGGGFSQVNYLTAMKQAYTRFLEHVGASSEEGLVAADIETERLTAETAYIFIKKNDQIVPATALDLIAYATPDTAFYLKELAQFCTLGDAIDQQIPDLYRILYHQLSPVPPPKFPYITALYA